MANTPDIHSQAEALIEARNWEAAAALLAQLPAADVAEIIAEADAEEQLKAFSLVEAEQKPDVLAELEGVAGAEVLESLSNHELSTILEEMAPDDAADVLADLPDKRSEVVLDLMEDEESEDVRRLMAYAEDSAGGIMTSDVVSMRENQTVGAALDAIAGMEDAHEPFYHANLVDADDHLIGSVEIWELLRCKDRSRTLGELANRDIVSVSVETDQEEVARTMSKYDLAAVPVVDVAGRLVGRVTSDDVLDVMEEEASEDILRLAGSDSAELEHGSVLKSCIVRLPWLFMTLFGGFFTSLILKQYHAHIGSIMVLAAFVPIVLAMGGNTGIQSSILIVRGIAIGSVPDRKLHRLLIHEIMTGAVMGLICGAVIGAWVHLVIARTAGLQPPMLPPMHLAGTVAIALFCAMTFAAMFGALVPILLNRMRIDPAVASGPFITIVNDIMALLIYFGVTLAILQSISMA